MDSQPAQQPSQPQLSSGSSYFCHACNNRTRQPMLEPEIHCPNCGSGFMEEVPAEPEAPSFASLFGQQGGAGPMMFGMPRVLIGGRPNEDDGSDRNEGQEGDEQGNANPLVNLFQSFFGRGNQTTQQRSAGASPPTGSRSYGTTFTFSAGNPGGPTFTRSTFGGSPNSNQSQATPQQTPSDPNEDPPDVDNSSRPNSEPVPIRSLSDFLQNAFGASPEQPANTNNAQPQPTAQPRQQNPPDLASALFSMLGGMASAERGGQPGNTDNGVQGRTVQGPGFQFFIGTGGGGGLGFPGQFGDFVFNERSLDSVISMLMAQAGGQEGPRRAPEEMINELPRQKWDATMTSTSPFTDCAVCKDDFEEGDETITLPCRHLYHDSCIKPWLERSGTCPTCRYALVEQPEQHPIAQGQAPQAPTASRPTPQGDVEMDGLD